MIFFYFSFWKAIKNAGLAHKKNRVGRVSGKMGIFLGLMPKDDTCLY